MKNEELQKHLVTVIDEAIAEIEELKKSKFAAQEVKIEGAGDDGIKGMKANGSIGKADEDEDEDEDDKEMDKADGVNNEADPDKGPFKQSETVGKADDCVDKADDDEEEKKKKKDEMDKADGVNNAADPDKGPFKQSATVGGGDMKKSQSQEDQEALLKSYVDDRFSALEKSIASILESVKVLADQPVSPRGVTVGQFAALKKNDEEDSYQPLNKSYVTDKLLSLQKSGEKVDSADIIKVETGSQGDIAAVAQKYSLVKR